MVINHWLTGMILQVLEPMEIITVRPWKIDVAQILQVSHFSGVLAVLFEGVLSNQWYGGESREQSHEWNSNDGSKSL